MSLPGWYPDPGGQPGKFRYWDGRAWSEALTSHPGSPPPSAEKPSTAPVQRPHGRTAWWIGGIAIVVVLGLVIWGLTRIVPAIVTGDNPFQPSQSGHQNVCPQPGLTPSTAATPQPTGKVASSHLSYAQLGAPWQAPQREPRMPFSSNASGQNAVDQLNYDGKGSGWVSQIVIGNIASGDGFASNKAAAEQVFSCALGVFYSDTVVKKEILQSTATTVDGHKAWLIDAQLSFTIAGLAATSERVSVAVVDVDPKSQVFGLFFSSVPNTQPRRLTDVQRTFKSLKVAS